MGEKSFFGPLTLNQRSETSSILDCEEIHECCCVLCENNYTLPVEEKTMLTHLFMDHRLVIADVNQIADLSEYMRYWRLRFRDQGLPFFCTTMLLDEKPDGTKSKDEEYFLLSDVLPEDKELRANLQQTKLENVMKRHQFEREDKNYEKECLFCRFTSKGTRASYLNHLFEKHNFHIAKPENLIFIDGLIEMVANKLEKLQCIYCEKFFKDRNILKEHMRKKGHKRINPENKDYDKYFLINYNGEKKQQYKPRHNSKSSNKQFRYHDNSKKDLDKAEQDSNIDSDPDWSDWTEEHGPLITCLICEHAEPEYDSLLNHMKLEHKFFFVKATKNLDFYHKVKIVNYIRRQIHLKQCWNCDTKFEDGKSLAEHIRDSNHAELNKENWDQPEYYFPTYEDDLFLCFIQDDDESWWSADEKEAEKRNSMSDCISKEMALAVLDG